MMGGRRSKNTFTDKLKSAIFFFKNRKLISQKKREKKPNVIITLEVCATILIWIEKLDRKVY